MASATGSQPPHNDPSQPLTPLSWEGEKMFNIYIYDYCSKRGFKKTARELLIEADITSESRPPIDARQGLLFEWWSVFWVLFQAKSNNGGSEDALLYTQHQANQSGRGRPPPGVPPQPQVQRPGQPPPAGVINGVGAAMPGQHQLPPGAPPMGFTMGGPPAPQLNGISAPHPPTPGSAPQHQQLPHGPQPPNFNTMIQPGQRPPSMNGPPQSQPLNGQQPQQRPVGTPNHGLPFQSPTMAHSPNVQQGPHPPPGQQPPGVGPQPAPMGNLSGPSPNMRGGMMPPQGMAMGGVAQQPHPGGPQGPNFAQMGGGRPPSRTNTPQQPGMMQQSPSMGNRQPMPPGTSDYNVETEFRKLSPQAVHAGKLDAGIPAEKDHGALTMLDKRKILDHVARRKPNTPGGPGTPMMPSNMQPQRGPQQQQQQQQQQQHHNRAMKRNSTSPGEEPEQSADSSPPDRKRPRRSPADTTMMQKGPNPMPYPPTPQQQMSAGPSQGPPGHLQQQPPPSGMPPHMMRTNMAPQGGPMQQQMSMNGHIPPPGMQMQSQPGPPPGQQGMGGMQGQMGPPMGMAMNQMGNNYARVPLHQVHNAAGAPNSGGPGPQRMVPPPPGAAGTMMPPPSPANAAAALNKDHKDPKLMMDMASPRGPQQQPMQQGGPAQQQGGMPQQAPGGQQISHPGTPGPQGPMQPSGGSGGPQQGGGGPGGPGLASSPAGSLMGAPMNLMDNSLFMGGSEFSMDSMASFDAGGFSLDTGTGIDFERDFGSWFNGSADDAMSTLDLK